MAEQNGLVVTLPDLKKEGYSDKGFCYQKMLTAGDIKNIYIIC